MNNLPRAILIIACVAFAGQASAQSSYKEMMKDMSFNFYDVCETADAYFETHDNGKGSGWKGYQRWKAENESKYYPSGDRMIVDPYFVTKTYSQFVNENGSVAKGGGRSFENGWRDLGPFNVDNITSHYSPGIGRVECFWVNPTNDQHIYMGSRSGGFWRTTTGGSSWVNTTDSLVASGVNTLAVSPTNSDSILINVRNGGNSTTHGIYRSIDGGLTWTETNFNPTNLPWGGLGSNAQILYIKYHPTIPDLVFIGTNRGLFRSDDDLQSWTQPLTTGWITDIEFFPEVDSLVFLYDDANGVNQNVVLRSTNFGSTFSQTAEISGNSNARGHIAVSPDCDSCVFFASNNGVWTSVDSGMTFALNSVPSQSCRGFAVSDVDADRMIYGYVDLQASSNGGQSFSDITDWAMSGSNLPNNYVHADLRTIECVNGVFYAGTDGFLCKSTDNGVNWDQLNNGTGIREFYCAGLSQSDWKVQMAGSQDNGTSIRNGNGWIEWNGGDGMEALVQPLEPDWMIGSWQFGTRNITLDGGMTRMSANNPEGGSTNANWQAPLLFDPNQQMRVFHFSANVFKSEAFGNGNWTQMGSPDIGQIIVADIAQNNSEIIAVARYSELRISVDGGYTFYEPQGTLPNFSITDIAFDPRNDSTMVITYNRFQADNQKVFISHDLGASWTNITGNLSNMPLRTVVIDHSAESNIYVGGELGVYYKAMNETDWTLYNPGLPNLTVRDLEIQYGTNVLRASTWGRGLWEYKLVDRVDYPAITVTEISEFPMKVSPSPLVDQYVTSRISYGEDLSEVYVLWSDSVPSFDNRIDMSNSMDSTWVTDEFIPHQPAYTDVYFKVVAIGENQDTTETYRFHYVSRQNPPEVPDTTIGIMESNFESPILVYPNPSNGMFSIDLGRWYDHVQTVVHNIEGKQIYSEKTEGQQIEVQLDQSPGMYFLTVTSPAKSNGGKPLQARIKLVID